MKYCVTKADTVRYVKERLNDLENGLPWTMTIEPDTSGGYYVSDATNSSSVGTLMPSYSRGPRST